jgi:ABC-type phosphate transport system substrate-binding protein
MKDLSIELKKKMGTDEEPFEGEVPIANIEKEIISIIRNSESNTRFIFDDYTHKTE